MPNKGFAAVSNISDTRNRINVVVRILPVHFILVLLIANGFLSQIEALADAPLAGTPVAGNSTDENPVEFLRGAASRAAADAPSINGATRFGARPHAPVLFKVPATGAKPLRYAASPLPEGLSIDARTGLISGNVSRPGSYTVRLQVSNRFGSAEREWTLRVGDEICLTPPLGWNSWYCHSELISEQAVRSTAKAMVESGLVEHGWTYINIDDCWQGERGGPFGAIQPNARFSNMQLLCEDLHTMGLKVGIYSTPWIGTYAGFIGGSAPNAAADYSAYYLPSEERMQPHQFFGRYPGSIDMGLNRVGHWLFDKDARQWAAWGIDYVKVDWKPNDVPTTKRIAADLRSCGRDIVLSLSNAAPLENVNELSRLAHCWRTTGDIRDSWGSIKQIAEKQQAWQPHTRPGHWNDMDMLQLGNLGIPNKQNREFNPTNLTRDEQQFHMSLWCLLQSPLLLSCDIATLDEFTLGLLTNDELLAIHQDALGKPARYLAQPEGYAWVKQLENGDTAIGFFNTSDREVYMSATARDLALSPGLRVRDLGKRTNLAPLQSELKILTPAHGARLVRIANGSRQVSRARGDNRQNEPALHTSPAAANPKSSH